MNNAIREGKDLTWHNFEMFMGTRHASTDLVTLAKQEFDSFHQGNESGERSTERFSGSHV